MCLRSALERDPDWGLWHWSCLIKHSWDTALRPERGDQDVQQTLLESSSPQGSPSQAPDPSKYRKQGNNVLQFSGIICKIKRFIPTKVSRGETFHLAVSIFKPNRLMTELLFLCKITLNKNGIEIFFTQKLLKKFSNNYKEIIFINHFEKYVLYCTDILS